MTKKYVNFEKSGLLNQKRNTKPFQKQAQSIIELKYLLLGTSLLNSWFTQNTLETYKSKLFFNYFYKATNFGSQNISKSIAVLEVASYTSYLECRSITCITIRWLKKFLSLSSFEVQSKTNEYPHKRISDILLLHSGIIVVLSNK